MQNYLIDTSELVIVDDEPRIMDLDLAAWLGMRDIHKVRPLIAANYVELSMHGEVSARRAETTYRGGRPGKAYYLNEGQALVLCALSRTPKAAQVRKALIDVFMAYRSGKLVHVKEHRRRLPNRTKPKDTYESNLSFVRAFKGQGDAMLSLIAGMMTRLDQLEKRP